MNDHELLWAVFGVIVTTVMVIDLAVLNRRAHEISLREAALWCAAWMALALGFGGVVYWQLGLHKALEFLTGYIIEYSLSMDNMFVFIMIFSYFAVPPQYQPRVLHWGILGAIIMRMILIFAGVALIHTFEWIMYIFGAILIFTGIKMAWDDGGKMDPSKNPVLKLFKKLIPFVDHFEGQAFFTHRHGSWRATPLLATVLVVEASDLVFAIDSIPAVLAISTDRLIVYTSNIFAIMGLRALYFLLSGIVGLFRYLKIGISAILCFVGVKMIMAHFYKVPLPASLGVIAGALAVSILASVLIPEKRGHD
ncbi:MAG: TerC family protein [Elusimicrobia bacterium]|nr:TerC family protein [Elusimicrobiota bacterium]